MKILALGTSCVDIYPQKEIITPGGEALNIAAHLSHDEEVQVYLMGQIGQDQYGEEILKSIEALPINLDHLYRVPGETAHHVIQVKKDGDRYFEEGAWHGGVSSQYRLTEKDKDLLAEAEGVITTLWETNLRELVAMKKDHPFILAVDFNEQKDLAQWEDLIGSLDIFFKSGDESMFSDFRKRSLECDTLFVLTLAEKGSKAFHRGREYDCEAVKVSGIVDTTGCGDCYQGHFLLEYIRSGDIVKAMKKGSQEAAKVTQYVGGFKTKDPKET